MPRQNRVTPWSTLLATAERGHLMGNRGCLHDDQQQIRRMFVGKRWILCQLAFRDRRLPIMAPGRYTQLFFLDEATALAAGHRPCAECLRPRFEQFRRMWASANPTISAGVTPLAPALDEALHRERISATGEKVVERAALAELPIGSIVVLDGSTQPYLVLEQSLRPWSPAGYGPALTRPATISVGVLTPRSVVRTLALGYPVMLHQSALGETPAARRSYIE